MQVFLMGLHRDNGAIVQMLRSSYKDMEYSVLIAPGEARVGGRASGILVAGYYDILQQIAPSRQLIIAATNPFRRATLFSRVPKGWKFLTVISEKLKLKLNSTFGDGCIIYDQSIIKNSQISNQVTVGRECYVEGAKVGEFSSIHSNATILTGVTIGRGVRIGHHAQVNRNVTIGNWCEVEPNAIVTKDMKDGSKWLSHQS